MGVLPISAPGTALYATRRCWTSMHLASRSRFIRCDTWFNDFEAVGEEGVGEDD